MRHACNLFRVCRSAPICRSARGRSVPLDGDCDGDGAVELYDLDGYSVCVIGPGGGLGLGCECLDTDADGHVDLFDFGWMQSIFAAE